MDEVLIPLIEAQQEVARLSALSFQKGVAAGREQARALVHAASLLGSSYPTDIILKALDTRVKSVKKKLSKLLRDTPEEDLDGLMVFFHPSGPRVWVDQLDWHDSDAGKNTIELAEKLLEVKATEKWKSKDSDEDEGSPTHERGVYVQNEGPNPSRLEDGWIDLIEHGTSGSRRSIRSFLPTDPEAIDSFTDNNVQTDGTICWVLVAGIQVDAERLQYREFDGADGLTDDRRVDFKDFNPLTIPPIALWRDDKDQILVVDGHKRVGFAKRAGFPVIRALFIVAATAEEAKAIGEGMNKKQHKAILLEDSDTLEDGDPLYIKAGQHHAPKGGVSIGGTEYKGGQFIPSEVMEKATAEERAKVEKGEKKGKKKAPPSLEPTPMEEAVHHIREIVHAMKLPKSAVVTINLNIKNVLVHESEKALTSHLRSVYGTRVPELEEGQTRYASFDRKTGIMHLTGHMLPPVIAHEIAHALDGPFEDKSGDFYFQKAWRKEAKNLSEYATWHPSEGLAELFRLRYEMGAEAVQKLAPGMCRALGAFWSGESGKRQHKGADDGLDDLGELQLKGMDNPQLVEKEIEVRRNGKVFKQRRKLRPEEAPKEKRHAKDEESKSADPSTAESLNGERKSAFEELAEKKQREKAAAVKKPKVDPEQAATAVHSAVAKLGQEIDAHKTQVRQVDKIADEIQQEIYKLHVPVQGQPGKFALPPESLEKFDELRKKKDSLNEQRSALCVKLRELREAGRTVLYTAMKEHIKTPARIITGLYSAPSMNDSLPIEKPNKVQKDAIDAAHDFLKQVCNWKNAPYYHVVRAKDGRAWCFDNYGLTPVIAVGRDWDGAGLEPTGPEDQTTQRNVASSAAGATKTHIHEIGHMIEFRKPKVKKMAEAFLKARIGEEQPKPLSELIGREGFNANEIGCVDKFRNAFGELGPYVGKIYKGGATEVVSMGLEMMYHDATGFAQKDPEYFQFMVKVLTV